MEKSQTLHTIRGRLNGMLEDVAHLKDQCQHLKMAHQVQRQEVHESLAFFSQKIIVSFTKFHFIFNNNNNIIIYIYIYNNIVVIS